ncbi:MAG TPA: arsenate reductase ArsC [Candidatus Thermoplasmatota archaeon]|nr:arsenate reductase ArsC [Candidatus Thermoplasmatota archaeon]
MAPVKVLFLCVGNAVRSQMAEGFARALGGDRVDARSGGSAPAGFVAPKAIAVMAERGIDISGQRSKGIDWDFMEQADAVVSTCHEAQDACPIPFRSDAHRWSIADPMGQGLEGYRAVRDEVEGRVRALLRELGLAGPDEKP